MFLEIFLGTILISMRCCATFSVLGYKLSNNMRSVEVFSQKPVSTIFSELLKCSQSANRGSDYVYVTRPGRHTLSLNIHVGAEKLA